MAFIKIILFENDLGCFLDYVQYPGVSRSKQLVFGLGDTSENPEIIEMMVSGFSHKQIEKL